MIPQHLEIAKSLLSMLEIGNNAGFTNKDFENKIKVWGWKPTYFWCAYFIAFCLELGKNETIKTRSGLARNYVTQNQNKLISINRLLNEDYKTLIKPGDLIVWQKYKGITGHIAMIEEVRNDFHIVTIEGNTSNGDKGSQSNGDGCYRRDRIIKRGTDAFHILGVISV